MDLAPFAFSCRGVVLQTKADKEGQFCYVSLLVGGVMREQFRVGAELGKRFGVGEEVVVRGAVVQATFKGTVSRQFEAFQVEPYRPEVARNGGAKAGEAAAVRA